MIKKLLSSTILLAGLFIGSSSFAQNLTALDLLHDVNGTQEEQSFVAGFIVGQTTSFWQSGAICTSNPDGVDAKAAYNVVVSTLKNTSPEILKQQKPADFVYQVLVAKYPCN